MGRFPVLLKIGGRELFHHRQAVLSRPFLQQHAIYMHTVKYQSQSCTCVVAGRGDGELHFRYVWPCTQVSGAVCYLARQRLTIPQIMSIVDIIKGALAPFNVCSIAVRGLQQALLEYLGLDLSSSSCRSAHCFFQRPMRAWCWGSAVVQPHDHSALGCWVD